MVGDGLFKERNGPARGQDYPDIIERDAVVAENMISRLIEKTIHSGELNELRLDSSRLPIKDTKLVAFLTRSTCSLMYVGKDYSPSELWHWGRKNLIRTLIISVVACVLYDVIGWEFVGISFLPVATIGTAVAFYVGFKNNQAYDRLWEARRLWGNITNTSRTLTAMVIGVVPDKSTQREFMYRHIAWVNILRLQLRKSVPWATSKESLHRDFVSDSHELVKFDEGLKQLFIDMNRMEYYEAMAGRSNAAIHILKKQIHELARLKKEGFIDAYEHTEFVRQISELFNHQGGCERIKNTPLFRQYSIFSRVFVQIFITLLPFGLLKEMDKLGGHGVWFTIPFSILISWVYFTMEQVGEFSENPFDNSENDTPISTICRTIEIEIREFLGDDNIPEKLNPVHDVLL
jgi:ion channel-forming bestrophin family protein